jgi:precorrin-6B methylase 2
MYSNIYKSYTSQYTRNIDPETNQPYLITGNATSTLSQENADIVAIGKVDNNTNIIDYILDILSKKYDKYIYK